MRKLLLIVFLFIVFYYPVNSQDLGSNNLSYSVSVGYGSMSLSDNNLAYLCDGNPGAFFVTVSGQKGLFRTKVGAWFYSKDLISIPGYGSVGKFSQNGGFVDLLLNAEVPLEMFKINFYGGGSGVYQKSTYEDKLLGNGTLENSGWGYGYVGGAELLYGNLGIFGEYRGIISDAGQLDVGSRGFIAGLKVIF